MMADNQKLMIENLLADQGRVFALLDDLLLAAATVTLHQNPIEGNSEIPNEALNQLVEQVAKTMSSIDYIACKDWYRRDEVGE